jgi:hypothetical protein
LSNPTDPTNLTYGVRPATRQFKPAACVDCGLVRDIGGYIPVDLYVQREGPSISLCLGHLASRREDGQRLKRAGQQARIISTFPDPDGEA